MDENIGARVIGLGYFTLFIESLSDIEKDSMQNPIILSLTKKSWNAAVIRASDRVFEMEGIDYAIKEDMTIKMDTNNER